MNLMFKTVELLPIRSKNFIRFNISILRDAIIWFRQFKVYNNKYFQFKEYVLIVRTIFYYLIKNSKNKKVKTVSS